MIQFLKESTFVVNDVINDAWEVLKKRYFAIAGLCFLLFLTSAASGVLGSSFNDVNIALSIFMLFLFITLFFGIQLTLFKHIFQILDKENNAVSLKESIPSPREMAYFFAAMLLVVIISLFSYLLISVLILPLIYANISISILVNIAFGLAFVFIFIMVLRLAFFPFFIIDKGENPLKSLRMSLAITKGNFMKLLMILAFFAMLNLLYLYFSYRGLPVISIGLSLINSFVVIPLSSVSIAIAYRKMMQDYHGSEDPEILKNIL